MAVSSLDIELSQYWILLSPLQKESLLAVIKSLIQSTEIKGQELNEAEAIYNSGDKNLSSGILKKLTPEQKEAIINLIESFGIEIPGQRISIEQYNKELDEAEAEFEKGEFLNHEEIIAVSKKWIHGK
ncbi:MAG: hypothetical protein WDN26_20560 [Chitinophagaceae bacterium]